MFGSTNNIYLISIAVQFCIFNITCLRNQFAPMTVTTRRQHIGDDCMSVFNIIGLSGSLRQASYNTAALMAAQAMVPYGVTITLADLSGIPIYNDDDRAKAMPSTVSALAKRISEADAVMIATPEYNYSVPGMLKNVIDWLSKVPDQPFRDKPMAILGASMGTFGTARAQYDLRKMFVFLDAHILNQPEIMIGSAHTRFDREGRLIDEETKKLMLSQIVALRDWALRLHK
jgi:chromate reductase, NAD(P)H dehydrogenase (quinone)